MNIALSDYALNIILVICLFIITVYYIYRKLRPVNNFLDIPEFKSSSETLGNLPDIKKCGSFPEFLQYIHKLHGPIVYFHLMTVKVVSIADHRYFKDLLHLSDRPGIFFENWKELLGEENIQFCNGTEGKERRKVYDRSFTQASLSSYIETMSNIGQRFCNSIKADDSTSHSIDIDSICFNMAAEAIVNCCMGPDVDSESCKKLIKYYKTFGKVLDSKYRQGLDLSKELIRDSNFSESRIQFVKAIEEIVQNRMQILDKEDTNEKNNRILLDEMILFHGNVNKSIIEADTLTFVIGGFHTTGNTMSFILYLLASHETVQDRLYKEVSNWYKEKFRNSVDIFRSIRDKLPYLRAVIDETLRWAQIGPFMARVSWDPIEVYNGKYVIPQGVPILGALGVALYDSKVFPNPDNFDPDRFMGENRSKLPNNSFEPFGFAGKRRCPGEKFSYLELSIWLIQILSEFEISLIDKNQRINKIYGIITEMNPKIKLQFLRRSDLK